MSDTSTTEGRNRPLQTAARQPGPRWKLVRVGEGPNRKWVWQPADPPGVEPGRRVLPRQ
jgi:hypothetical protein